MNQKMSSASKAREKELTPREIAIRAEEELRWRRDNFGVDFKAVLNASLKQNQDTTLTRS